MNVFVLSTGRCGSTTFVRACTHFTNFTAGHETRSRVLGPTRLHYPPNHIESDNRLSWFLGRLDEAYSDDAFYVHLTRDSALVAKSYSRLTYRGGIMQAYYDGILMRLGRNADRKPPSELWEEIGLDLCATVDANIRLFLKDKTNTTILRIETAKEDFGRFMDRIGAEGDRESALAEWDVRHNKDMYTPASTRTISHRINRKIQRVYAALKA